MPLFLHENPQVDLQEELADEIDDIGIWKDNPATRSLWRWQLNEDWLVTVKLAFASLRRGPAGNERTRVV